MSAASEPPVPSHTAAPRRLTHAVGSVRLVAMLTLVSRVMGLLRDMSMAALFGNGLILDAFTVAFRIPNLVRGLFGEGALASAFLPAYLHELSDRGENSAWRLASAVFLALTTILTLSLIGLEVVLYLIWAFAGGSHEFRLLIELTILIMPYLVLICLTAQLSAMLQARRQFAVAASTSTVMNVVWLASVLFVAPRFADPLWQIRVIAGSVVCAGVCQVAIPFWALWRQGFRLRPCDAMPRERLASLFGAMLPIIGGLAVTQFNTLVDSLVAWGFSHVDGSAAVMPLPGSPHYPMTAGAASALYLAQRLYQFPLGVFGVALGTVLFPLLTEHAQRKDFAALRSDVLMGLRLTMAIGLPAGLGLWLLAEPIARLFFQYGRFSADDALQTAKLIGTYGLGVWAFCGQIVIQRAYFAVGDRVTPLRSGLVAVAMNVVCNLSLIWVFREAGLALSTSLVAVGQVVWLTWRFQQHCGPISWREWAPAGGQILLAAGVMAAAVRGSQYGLAFWSDGWPARRFVDVAIPCLAGVAAYGLTAALIRLREPFVLFRRSTPASTTLTSTSMETDANAFKSTE